jgi:hypothetical protein
MCPYVKTFYVDYVVKKYVVKSLLLNNHMHTKTSNSTPPQYNCQF